MKELSYTALFLEDGGILMNNFDLLKLVEKHINEANTTEDISKTARDIIGMSPRDSHFDNAYSWVPKDYDFNRIHVEPGKHQVYEEPDEFYILDKVLIWLDPDFRRAADKIKRRYNLCQGQARQ